MTLVFGLEGHEGCKVAANIIHGFDCTLDVVFCVASSKYYYTFRMITIFLC